jgi:hypothetical protein
MSRWLFEDNEINVILFKSYFMSSLLDWTIVHVPNFPLGNLVDLICFLDYSSS